MTVSVASIVTVSKAGYDCLFHGEISILLAIVPIMVIAISLIGIFNLRRKYCRFLDWVTISDKLQEKLGLKAWGQAYTLEKKDSALRIFLPGYNLFQKLDGC